jgi:glycosyltransferase involved in cell wall biosynthesis
MGRLDKRKRPRLALQLAKEFPDVKFNVAGKSRTLAFEADLKKEFGHLPNVDFLGFIDQFEGDQHHQLYSEAWIHINTSIREGLPNSFIEAAGHQCAILSHVNPDRFASSFGFHVTGVNYREGLHWLLQDNRWKDQGLEGYQYVSANYELNKAIDAHEIAFLKAFEQHKKK